MRTTVPILLAKANEKLEYFYRETTTSLNNKLSKEEQSNLKAWEVTDRHR